MFFLSLIVLLVAFALLGVTLWNVLAWPGVRKAAARGGAAGRVSILIPARDEEENIGACLDAALAGGEAVGEVLVYDDHSADGTARIAGDYARRDARVRLLASSPLPADWRGKTFACAQLAAAARGEWLLFLDADARLTAGAAARMVGEAEARGATLVSCWPALEMRGFWEGALMPMLNFVVFTLYPGPLSFRRADASLGLAHGACILARRDAYAAVGGHAAVRGEVFEDTRLAQVWRERGARSLCLDGRGVVALRMYRGPSEIWAGFQKNFFPAFRRGRSFWVFLALHFAVFLLPFVAAPFALAGGGAALASASWWWPLTAAALCVLAARAALALRFRHPLWSALLHPAAEIFLLALGLSSWWKFKTGRGVVWKGRRLKAEMRAEG